MRGTNGCAKLSRVVDRGLAKRCGGNGSVAAIGDDSASDSGSGDVDEVALVAGVGVAHQIDSEATASLVALDGSAGGARCGGRRGSGCDAGELGSDGNIVSHHER